MSDPYLGEIRMFGGAYAPVDWLFCDGSLLSVNQYQALFSLLGVTYGGDGVTTFAIPDLRGKTPIGMGSGTGLTTRILGQKGGETAVTLTIGQTPAHTHPVMASTDNAGSYTPGGTTVLAGTAATPTVYTNIAGADPSRKTFVFNVNAVAVNAGGQSHDNVMASIGINFIICVVNGLYPTPS